MSNPLQDSAMLVGLNISVWTARKHNKAVTNEVDQAHAAKGAGRYNDLLVPKDSLKPITQVASAVRQYLYKKAFAWGNNGDRLLPSAIFLDFGKEIDKFRSEFAARVRDFKQIYPQLKADARTWRGTLYDPADYPDDISDKFDFPPMTVLPVPSAGDFRVNLSAEYVESIKKDIEERERVLKEQSNKECWSRLREYTAKIVEVCNEPKSKIFDSLMDNPREFISILPHMNLLGDKALNDFGVELESILVPPDRLRNDKTLKANTGKLADALLAKLP